MKKTFVHKAKAIAPGRKFIKKLKIQAPEPNLHGATIVH